MGRVDLKGVHIYTQKCMSGKKLAELLGIDCVYRGEVIRAGAMTEKLKAPINYGVNLPAGGEFVFNRNASNASDKVLSYRMMAGAGVNCPQTIDASEVGCYTAVLLRKNGLSGGRGIRIVRRGRGFPGGFTYDFIVPLYDIVEEYRVHVFRKNRITSSVKIREYDDGRPKSAVIRSYSNGYRFYYIGLVNREVHDIAVNAISALKLDFGAVDVGLLRDGSLMVLEVNSAPGIVESQLSLNRYRQVFAKFVFEGE